MASHNIWRKTFISILASSGNVGTAAKAAGITPRTAYRAKEKDKDFAEEWQEALDLAADVLEAEAWRRAHEGVEEPVMYKGQVVRFVRKYSDLLLMFMLKGMRPEKFREKVYVSPHELDKLIEQQLRMLKGEEDTGADQLSEKVN